jgi:hypothetical protein
MGTADRELPGPAGVVVALEPVDSPYHPATHALVFHDGSVRLTPANGDVRVALERAVHLGNRICVVGHTTQREPSDGGERMKCRLAARYLPSSARSRAQCSSPN